MNTSKPVAVVTGGSRGIGRAICLQLAKDGFHVVVNYAKSRESADTVVSEITGSGGSAVAMGFDVANPDEVDAAFEKIGAVEVLVNNAGITSDALLLRMKNEDLDRTLNVDLKGAIFCTRAVTKPMMKARKGSIVFISSVVGETGNAGQAAYSAAKAGMLGFMKSVARELSSRNIRSNAITPGYIQTEMTGVLTESQKEAILRSIPIGTLGQPEDIAYAVSFLASDKSRYVTGQVLGINGGMLM
ncbi:MAG: 3-oxoacyl-[acyl-carrier-protein] reductase [Bdellovibrionales bacterium]|nr:3-oxoacyl-[acyl-carrier-protein] reductase [Bdellovibrionales bacterium]